MADAGDISRRSLLSGRMLGQVLRSVGDELAGALATGAPHETATGRHGAFPLLRPPRAVAEPLFLAGCTRCRACLESCPHGAIVPAPARFRAAAETPMIDPITQPCLMCVDTPCVAACEPAVLRPELPVRMGTARINVVTCMAHQGGFCTVCSEHCPVDGAIEVRSGRPSIDASACTGCGVCQHVCPAPENAVLLTPAEARPDPRATEGESPSVTGAQVAPLRPSARSKPPAPWEHDLELVADPFARRLTAASEEEADRMQESASDFANGTAIRPGRGSGRGA